MSPLLQIPLDFKARIEGLPAAAGVPVVAEDLSDPANQQLVQLMQGALPANGAGKTGIAILLLVPGLVGDPTNPSSLVKGDMTVRLMIYESLEINRGPGGIGVNGAQLAWACMKSIQGWRPTAGAAAWRLGNFDSSETDSGVIAHQIDFVAQRTLG
jgi:hypothetical protein